MRISNHQEDELTTEDQTNHDLTLSRNWTFHSMNQLSKWQVFVAILCSMRKKMGVGQESIWCFWEGSQASFMKAIVADVEGKPGKDTLDRWLEMMVYSSFSCLYHFNRHLPLLLSLPITSLLISSTAFLPHSFQSTSIFLFYLPLSFSSLSTQLLLLSSFLCYSVKYRCAKSSLV